MKKNIPTTEYSEAAISCRLQSAVELHFFEELPSTNTYLKECSYSGMPLCAIAKRQTNGRGRRGNSFLSPGGIYLSVLLPIGKNEANLPCLTAFAGIKVCDAIEEVCGIHPQIKWVNDIIFREKKIAGILAELSPKGDHVIIGAGINTDRTSFPPEISDKAGDIETLTSTKADKALLAARIADGLISLKDELSENTPILLNKYKVLCCTIGREVTVCTSPPYRAYAIGIDDDCSLIVKTEDNNIKRIYYGEVSILGEKGYI